MENHTNKAEEFEVSVININEEKFSDIQQNINNIAMFHFIENKIDSYEFPFFGQIKMLMNLTALAHYRQCFPWISPMRRTMFPERITIKFSKCPIRTKSQTFQFYSPIGKKKSIYCTRNKHYLEWSYNIIKKTNDNLNLKTEFRFRFIGSFSSGNFYTFQNKLREWSSPYLEFVFLGIGPNPIFA